MDWILDLIKNADWGQVVFTAFIALIGNSVLVKAYFDKKLSNQRIQHEKDLANANDAFNLKISEINAALESGTFVTNIQYEREYSLLQDIWTKFISFNDEYEAVRKITYSIIYEGLEASKYRKEYDEIMESVNVLKMNLESIAPFINNEIFKSLFSDIAVFKMFFSILESLTRRGLREVDKHTYNDITGDLFNATSNTRKKIYDYLNSLRVVK